LHEISHFFGTTEDEAIHLQTLCQEDILKFDFLATWPQINNYNFAVGEVDDLIKNKPKNLAGSYNYWFDLYHKAQKIYPYLDCSNSMYDAKLSLLRARERDDLLANFAKLVVIGDFACSMDPESPYAKDCLAQTNALFAGAEVVSTSKVLGLQDMSCFAHYDQFPQSDPQITRVRSLADFGRQLDEVSTGFQGFVKSIYQFQDLSTFKFPLIIVKNQAQIKGLRN
jgi:hypothetical protein